MLKPSRDGGLLKMCCGDDAVARAMREVERRVEICMMNAIG